MKNNGNIIFTENSIYSLILIKKLKWNQNFSIWKNLKILFLWKNNGNVDFVGNSFNSLILVTKLKRILIPLILKVLKILYNEK